MKFLSESAYHKLFEIGVVLKTIASITETIFGIFLYFLATDAVNRILFSPFGDLATEWPLNHFHGISAMNQPFWAFTFFTHGLLKTLLVMGLLRHKLWAYPASAAVFALFVVSQVYRMIFIAPSAYLAILNILDLILIGLILHEYRYAKRRNGV